jgi:hypothetical protein
MGRAGVRRGGGGRGHGSGARERERTAPRTDIARQRQVVDAFLAAARGGDFEALLALLDPDVVIRSDFPGAPRETRGAARYARQAAAGGARAAAEGAWAAQAALVNGAVGVIVAPRGRLQMVSEFTIENGKIVAIELITDPDRLRQLELAVLED